MGDWTTEEIRYEFTHPGIPWSVRQQEGIFDAWLTAHDYGMAASLLADLIQRCERAEKGLRDAAFQYSTRSQERRHLLGKADGMHLALSYLAEERRMRGEQR